MQVQNAEGIQIQEIVVHCSLCQGDTKIKAFTCPACKTIVLIGEQEPCFSSGPKHCTACGSKLPR
jgi:DNA replicative helicase MCM subunit Mcm2 (Cdc46/Mcm family)